MADKKLNTGPAENISPEAAEPIATPEQAAASEPQQEQTGPAIPESGDVVVSFDKINELMAEKRQNACAEVEKAAPDKPKPSKRDKVSRSDGKAPDAKEPIKPAQDTEFDPVELYEARRAIRPVQEKESEKQLEDAMHEKPFLIMLLGAKQETSRLLGEDAEERQVRQLIAHKRQEQHRNSISKRKRSDPER